MDKYEKPREKLMKYGVASLEDYELIALLLHTGSKDMDVLSLSKVILEVLHEFDDLKRIRLAELLHIKGIKLAKAATILAAVELGRRLTISHQKIIKRITSYEDVFHLLHPMIGHTNQEHLVGIYLNTKGFIIHHEIIFKGTINQTLIHPRELFHVAIKVSSSAIIFVHNHPTGDATPSKADIDITHQIMEIGALLHIEVMDHFIIGHQSIYSIKHQKEILVVI